MLELLGNDSNFNLLVICGQFYTHLTRHEALHGPPSDQRLSQSAVSTKEAAFEACFFLINSVMLGTVTAIG